MAELSAKTNQFNLSLRRMNAAELALRLDDRDSRVVTIGLADRLSDSGIVALMVGAKNGDELRVDELCVSCRALGRRIEDTMLTKAVLLMAGESTPHRVVFALRKGPRNAPAREWLERYADVRVDDDASEVSVPFDRIAQREVSAAIRITVGA